MSQRPNAAIEPQQYYKLGKKLVKAVKRNDVAGVKAALEGGASSFFVSDFLNPTTPVHMATKNGNKEIVELLLKHKSEKVELDKLQLAMKNPIEIAAEERNVALIELLIENGFSETKVKTDTSSGVTPALPSHSSLLNGFREGALVLMRHWNKQFLEPGKTTMAGKVWSEFHILVTEGDGEKIIEWLQAKTDSERQAEINSVGPFDVIPFHIAAGHAPLNAFKYMTEHGGDLAALDKVRKTAVHYACASGRLDNLKYLLDDRNAELRVDENDTYATPLEIAVKYNRHEVVQYLLFESKRPNLLRRTELYLASYRGATESARILAKAMEVPFVKKESKPLPAPVPISAIVVSEEAAEVKPTTEESKPSEQEASDNQKDETQTPADTTPAETAIPVVIVTPVETVTSTPTEATTPTPTDVSTPTESTTPAETVTPTETATTATEVTTAPAETGSAEKTAVENLITEDQTAADPPLIVPSLDETDSLAVAPSSKSPSEPRFSLTRCLHIGTDHPSLVRFLIEELGADPNGKEEEDDSMPALLRAVKSAPLESVEILVEHGANVNARTEKLNAFSMSVILDREEISKYLLSKGAEPGDTDLIYAVQNMNDDIIRLLVLHGVNLNRPEENSGQTPLMIAIQNNDVETVKLLIEHKADIQTVDKKKGNALQYAVSNASLDVVKILLDNGASLKQGNDESPLLHFACFGQDLEVVKFLVENGADIHLRHKDTQALPLHNAVLAKSDAVVEYLLEKGADINSEITNSLKPIHLAAEMLSPSITKLLLNKGADPNSLADHKLTPLHQVLQSTKREYKKKAIPASIMKEMYDTMQVLIDAGANPGAQDSTGASLLHVAVTIPDSVDILKLLVKAKADLNVQTENKISVLTNACISGNKEAVKYLVDEVGQTVNPECYISPLGAACLQGDEELVKFLIDKKADVNFICPPSGDMGVQGYFPIHLACVSKPTKKLVELLTEAGSDVNQQTLSDQCTPMHLLAAKEPSKDVLESQEYLFSKGAIASLTVKNDEGRLPFNMMNDAMKKVSSIQKRTVNLLQKRSAGAGVEDGEEGKERTEEEVPKMFTYAVIGVGVMIGISIVHGMFFAKR